MLVLGREGTHGMRWECDVKMRSLQLELKRLVLDLALALKFDGPYKKENLCALQQTLVKRDHACSFICNHEVIV